MLSHIYLCFCSLCNTAADSSRNWKIQQNVSLCESFFALFEGIQRADEGGKDYLKALHNWDRRLKRRRRPRIACFKVYEYVRVLSWAKEINKRLLRN